MTAIPMALIFGGTFVVKWALGLDLSGHYISVAIISGAYCISISGLAATAAAQQHLFLS